MISDKEFEKCRISFQHFFENYVNLPLVGSNARAVKMTPGQKKFVESLERDKFSITLKHRITGATSILISFALWKIFFNENVNIFICGWTSPVSFRLLKGGFTKISRQFLDKLGFCHHGYDFISFGNSRILVDSFIPLAISFDLIIFDEMAYHQEQEKKYSHAMSRSERVAMISSVGYDGGWFEKFWLEPGDFRRNVLTLKDSFRPLPRSIEEFYREQQDPEFKAFENLMKDWRENEEN